MIVGVVNSTDEHVIIRKLEEAVNMYTVYEIKENSFYRKCYSFDGKYVTK
jgi:hypothetical protein